MSEPIFSCVCGNMPETKTGGLEHSYRFVCPACGHVSPGWSESVHDAISLWNDSVALVIGRIIVTPPAFGDPNHVGL